MKIFAKWILFLIIFFCHTQSYGKEGKIVFQIFLHGDDSYVLYSQLTKYINKKLNTNYIPVFEEKAINAGQMLYTKEAHFGFICSGPYSLYKDDFKLEPLVAVKSSFKNGYRTYIFTKVKKPYKNILNFKGKSFSMTYLESFTGRLVPLAMLKEKNQDPLNFFSEIIYAKSHSESIFNVLNGKAEGGAAMSLVYEYMNLKNPEINKNIVVIDKSKEFSPPLFVASKFISDKEKKALKKILLEMHNDPEGRKILEKNYFERFSDIKKSDYEDVIKFIEPLKYLLP